MCIYSGRTVTMTIATTDMCLECTTGIMLQAFEKGPEAKALAEKCIECIHIKMPQMKPKYLDAIKKKFPKYKTKDHFVKADTQL